MSDITLPAEKIVLIRGRESSNLIQQNLTAAYWLMGRDDHTAIYKLTAAHDDFAKLADAMGYTIARKEAPASVEDAA